LKNVTNNHRWRLRCSCYVRWNVGADCEDDDPDRGGISEVYQIVVVFAVCWLPQHVYFVVVSLCPDITHHQSRSRSVIFVRWFQCAAVWFLGHTNLLQSGIAIGLSVFQGLPVYPTHRQTDKHTNHGTYITHHQSIQHVYLVIYWFAMSNAMYNPIIYCWMNARSVRSHTRLSVNFPQR